MIKKVLIVLLMTAIVGAGAFLVYRAAMPELIAEATVSESLSNYIPKRLKTRVDAIKNPINAGAEAMIRQMHASEIPVEQVIITVDNITEEEMHAFLDAVNASKPATPDEVFDLLKQHFPADFNTEPFRKPFTEHFQMQQIRRALAYANLNRKSNDVDLETAKAIVKKLIIEKDKEVRQRDLPSSRSNSSQ